MSSISARLVALRERLGYSSQTDFSNKVGIGRSTYAKMENGPNDPSVASLLQIATSLPHVNMNWLLTGKGEITLSSEQPRAVADPSDKERIRELERELAREKAWTEKLWHENQQFRELGKTQASSDAADTKVIPMFPHREIAA